MTRAELQHQATIRSLKESAAYWHARGMTRQAAGPERLLAKLAERDERRVGGES